MGGTSKDKKQEHDEFVDKGFTYSKQGALDGLVSAYQNESFSYDPEADEAFQNYAKMMRKQGSLAMEDTMGKAAAMTGGYGNSYAETAGQSMYNQYLGTIDAKAEDYYDRALDQFDRAQNQRLNAINLMKGERADEREAWEAEEDRLYGLYTDAYNTEENAKTQAMNDALVKGQMTGDWSDYEALMGWDEGSISKYLAGVAESEKTENEKNDDGATTVPYTTTQYNDILNVYNTQGFDAALNKINGLADAFKWTEDEANNFLYAIETAGELPLSGRTWTISNDTSNGGFPWFDKGVDWNDEYTDQYNNVFKLSDLRDALIEAGMSEKDAKDYVLSLTKAQSKK